jgi:predicted glycoside hydrolase/deacetylase ChbG (UPF0249 family)
MPPARLIVNADDLGNGAATDRGIFAAFARGVVTSASLLTTGPTWREAAQHAAAEGLPLGIHLNLSEGTALSGPIPGLTDDSGRFLGKTAARRSFETGHIETSTLTREFLAQIDRACTVGVTPDHLDTHQHCALFTPVAEAFCTAAQTCGIRRARLPLPLDQNDDAPLELSGELALYRQRAPSLTKTLHKADIITPQGLYGMSLLNQLNETQLLALLTQLQPGDWELMVHPGYRDLTHPFATLARETELAALSAPTVAALVRARGIELISFGDLQCAC